jgi:phospholipase D1/2
MTDPDRFFLRSELTEDDLRFRASARRGAKVTPLVDARKAYGEMEKAIVAARSTVHLCWWEFDPATPLISSAASKVGGGRTWIDLLEAKARGARGLDPAHVRMIIADSDPTFFGGQHAKTWAAFDVAASRRTTLSAAARARFEVIVGLHPALIDFDDLGFGPRKLLTAAAEQVLEGQRDRLNEIIEGAGSDGAAIAAAIDDAKEEFRNRPGLWRNLTFDTATDRFRLVASLSLSLRPASHHHKLCLVDGLTAFCGGLDIAPGRIDDSKHRASEPWHDIQCKVEGAPVFDMERDFFRRWNKELGLFKAFVEEVNEIRPPLRVSHPDVKPMTAQAGSASVKRRPGSALVQIIRTVSDVVPTGELLPNVIRKDIEESFRNAIANAERFVYLENQYTRWLPLADAIVARHATTPIKVIVVVPTKPEEVRAPLRDALTNHGMFLQNQFLQRLKTELGSDVGLFALAQKSAVSTPDPLDLFGSPQVYVHSKIMIVDDVFAMIGSANANGRGLFVDGELDIAWASPSAVRTFRIKLWAELLGGPEDLSSWRSELFVEHWKFVAEINRSAPPLARIGFVVPNDPSAADAGSEFGLPEASKLI